MTVSDGVSPSHKGGGGAEPARPPLNPPLVRTLILTFTQITFILQNF